MTSLATQVGMEYNKSKKKRNEGDVGIEIELETMDAAAYPFTDPNWLIDADGSLKYGHGYEFMTRKPLKRDEVEAAVFGWRAAFDIMKMKPLEGSRRTSVHVHINVKDFTHLQLYTLISCYWLVEPLLVSYAGEYRKGNNFCLSLADASAMQSAIVRGLQRRDYLWAFMGKDWRYSALNLDALRKFGSVEFRMMRGVYEPALISEWACQLHDFCHNTQEYETPDHVLQQLSRQGQLKFLRSLFSNEFVLKLVDAHGANWHQDMIEASLNVLTLANAKDKWVITDEDKQNDEFFQKMFKEEPFKPPKPPRPNPIFRRNGVLEPAAQIDFGAVQGMEMAQQIQGMNLEALLVDDVFDGPDIEEPIEEDMPEGDL